MTRPISRPVKSDSWKTGPGHLHFKIASGDSNVQFKNHWLGVKTRKGLTNHLTQCQTMVKMSKLDLHGEQNIAVCSGKNPKMHKRSAEGYKL